VSARSLPRSTPRPSSEGVLTAAEWEIRRCYCAIRSCIPTLGVQATLLHVGHERTGVVTGSDAAPEAILMLELGSRRVAREHFRHLLPTEAEQEGAIAAIEDEVARAGPMLSKRSTLFTTNEGIRQIATAAGVPARASMILRLELVEQTFGRFVSAALGQSPLSNSSPLDREAAATLLILREFMHHLQFGSINVVLQPCGEPTDRSSARPHLCPVRRLPTKV
jgi:hypothetical protein